MIAPDRESLVMEKVEPTVLATAKPTKRVGGRAWIESDKNGRQVVHVEVDGARFERKRKDVVVDDADLAVELASALKAAPVNVSVELKADRIVSVRRA
jgi:hypothetical protein